MKPLNIGRFNKKITFLQYTTTKDAMGQDKQLLQPIKTVYGDLYRMRATETTEAKRVTEKTLFKCYVRWFSGLTTDYKVRYKDIDYEIVSVIDIDYANVYYELQLVLEG